MEGDEPFHLEGQGISLHGWKIYVFLERLARQILPLAEEAAPRAGLSPATPSLPGFPSRAVWKVEGTCERETVTKRMRRESLSSHQLVCLLLPFCLRPPGAWN